jgi:hypothetical protein
MELMVSHLHAGPAMAARGLSRHPVKMPSRTRPSGEAHNGPRSGPSTGRGRRDHVTHHRMRKGDNVVDILAPLPRP